MSFSPCPLPRAPCPFSAEEFSLDAISCLHAICPNKRRDGFQQKFLDTWSAFMLHSATSSASDFQSNSIKPVATVTTEITESFKKVTSLASSLCDLCGLCGFKINKYAPMQQLAVNRLLLMSKRRLNSSTHDKWERRGLQVGAGPKRWPNAELCISILDHQGKRVAWDLVVRRKALAKPVAPGAGVGTCLPLAAEPHRHSAVGNVLGSRRLCGRKSVVPAFSAGFAEMRSGAFRAKLRKVCRPR
jgi:hypothetical protein